MDSKSITEQYPEFSEWMIFTKELIPDLPTGKGSFVFRKVGGEQVKRTKGESDILYIGSTVTESSLRNRLEYFFKPRKKSSTENRINSYLWKNQIELTYIIETKPGEIEQQLLKQYEKEHSELPPFNPKRKKGWKIPFVDNVHLKYRMKNLQG